MSSNPNVKNLSRTLNIPTQLPGQVPVTRRTATSDQSSAHVVDNNETDQHQQTLQHNTKPTVNTRGRAPRTNFKSIEDNTGENINEHNPSPAQPNRRATCIHQPLDSAFDDKVHPQEQNELHSRSLPQDQVTFETKESQQQQQQQRQSYIHKIFPLTIGLLILSIVFNVMLYLQTSDNAYQISRFLELSQDERISILKAKNDLANQFQALQRQYNGIKFVTAEQEQYWQRLETVTVLYPSQFEEQE